MLVTEKTILGADGTPLCLTVWEPDTDTRGVIQLIHGFGESAGRYTHWARRFTERGIAVYASDQRGHGKTPGRRGIAESFGLFLSDADTVRGIIGEEQPGLPVSLYGHSMGGNAVLNRLLNPCSGYVCAVVSCPWLRLNGHYPRNTMDILRAVSRYMPNFTLHVALRRADISGDQEQLLRTLDGANIHNRIAVRILLQTIRAGENAIARAADIAIPLLYLQGGRDSLASPRDARDFLKAAADGGVTEFTLYPTQCHELHNDTMRDAVFARIMAFFALHGAAGT
jgi:alpha-beta hydrolase superfamily lysophospholipase